MIKLISYLLGTCRREILMVAGLGLLGGTSSAALVAVVNRALHDSSATWLAGGFILAAVLKIAAGVLSNVLILQMVHRSILQLCDDMCRRVIETPFRRLEEVGTPRILASLTDDVTSLSLAIQEIPHLTVNISVLVGCALYLAYVSWAAALSMLGVVVIGGLCYRQLLKRAQHAFELARDSRDTLFRHFRSLTEGIKELKLNRQRRTTFLADDIGGAVEKMRVHNVRAVKQHIIAGGWSQVVFYALLAILLFVLPAAQVITQQALTAYVFTALFTATPLWAIIASLPLLSRGQTALERIEKLGLSLDTAKSHEGSGEEISVDALSVRFEGVEFEYADNGNRSGFALGPLDLELDPGELVFVIGGNGSGKSTFVKVLTGLYSPQKGEIRVNGKRVDVAGQDSYRQLFSVVYSDFYLFDRLPGIAEDLQFKVQEYLLALQLAHKVELVGDTLSTTALSQGQRRRLALLMAYLEDRPIYVLDEWAADQDPTFREVFYTQLLPELKRRRKIVVVVTHDDRYYHLGDRILNLDYGKISEWEGPTRAALPHAMRTPEPLVETASLSREF